jgi:hypothetical protein
VAQRPGTVLIDEAAHGLPVQLLLDGTRDGWQ